MILRMTFLQWQEICLIPCIRKEEIMENRKITPFHKKEEYRKKVEDKVKEVLRLCNQNDIPCIMIFGVDSTEDQTDYAIEYLSPGQKNQILKQNYFADFVNVMNGFRTVPFTKEDAIDLF